MVNTKTKIRWHPKVLSDCLDFCLKRVRSQKRLIGDASPFWIFIHDWPKQKAKLIADFIAGTYRFEPLITHQTTDEKIIVWSYTDRLFIRTLLRLIRPLFKHIISPKCFHLKGTSGVKEAIKSLNKALNKNKFRYFLRIDIKSYYASVDHEILLKQVKTHFKDARVLKYLEEIITIPVIENAAIYTHKTGIPIRSSLSPFFGALYLSPLDNAFANLKDVAYARYMDDVLILVKTKKQFCQTKKRLQKILNALKLKCSKHKTKMGTLTKGFHFLGVNFNINDINVEPSKEDPLVNHAVAQTQQVQSQVNTTLHTRSCVRAMDKILVAREDSVNPADAQRYLSRWSSWWSRTAPMSSTHCLTLWIQQALKSQPGLSWLASGIIAFS